MRVNEIICDVCGKSIKDCQMHNIITAKHRVSWEIIWKTIACGDREEDHLKYDLCGKCIDNLIALLKEKRLEEK